MTKIMGILNLTPDSFSDGGEVIDTAAALRRADAMRQAGAEIIDVGGESTRPGATPVTPAQEQARIADTVQTLAAAGFTVSVDTLHASTADKMLRLGAKYINDVSGGLHDPEMYSVVAAHGAHYILGHWRGALQPGKYRMAGTTNITATVKTDLAAAADRAAAAGISPERTLLDPGIGFDKTPEQCWELLRNIDSLQQLGYPLLIGVSRKRLIAETLAAAGGDPADMLSRDAITAQISAHCLHHNVWGVRVHNVAYTAAALKTAPLLHAQGTAPAAGTAAAAAPAVPQAADRITLTGLEVYAHHGVLESERAYGQRFYIDCVAELAHPAGQTADEISRAVNYAELADRLHTAATHSPVALLETLAERLAATALELSGIAAVTLTVHKPQAPIPLNFTDVSVTITRQRTL